MVERVSNRIVLYFGSHLVELPIIYRLVKDYDLVLNILKADINPHKKGFLVLELSGTPDNYQKGIAYLQARGIDIESLTQEILWNKDKCIQCGACIAVCPSQALNVQRPEMEVSFDSSRCVVCKMCIKSCPARAMEVSF